MAALYEFDFKPLDEDEVYKKYPDVKDAVLFGTQALATGQHFKDKKHVIQDLLDQHKSKGTLTESQQDYLLRLSKRVIPEFAKYEADFFVWYASRPDIQAIYKMGIGEIWYVPANGEWVYKGHAGWDAKWDETPDNTDMFWRVANGQIGRAHV